jgi:hypothetical protein
MRAFGEQMFKTVVLSCLSSSLKDFAVVFATLRGEMTQGVNFFGKMGKGFLPLRENRRQKGERSF